MLRGRGPSLRQVAGNLHAEALPGGNLISALLDRQLMAWSDRGGASRHLGDRWSELCSEALGEWVGTYRPIPGDEPFLLEAVVRLDDDPRIAIQAGRHKLTNPDFILYGQRPDGRRVLQAADAKFAVDTIKSSQVAAPALQALLDIESGLVRHAIEREMGETALDDVDLVPGIFLSPVSPLTDYFLPRLLTDPRHTARTDEIVLLPVEPLRMFRGLALTPLIGRLARIDRLPEGPRVNLLAAIYYFRVASAGSWMWIEERTPLLTVSPPPDLDAEALAEEIAERARTAESAYALLLSWWDEIEALGRARQAIADVASVPVSMAEIRARVEAIAGRDDRRLVRRARGALERVFRDRLVERYGEVPARPDRPLPEVLQELGAAARSLRHEMLIETERLIVELGQEQRESA